MDTRPGTTARRPCRPASMLSLAARRMTAFFLCAVFIAQPSPSQAPSHDPPAAAPPEPAHSYVSVAAAAFHPANDSYIYGNTGDRLHVNSPTGEYAYFYAGLHLPHGSAIKRVTFIYVDTDITYNCHLRLFRAAASTGTVYVPPEMLMELSSSGSGGPGMKITPDDWPEVPVSNNLYDYYFEFMSYGLETATDLRAVVVDYMPPGWLDPDYLNVPPAAFVPYSREYNYKNDGYRIENLDGNPTAHFEAPVLLPDGATAQWAQYYYYDYQTPQNSTAHLHRTDLKGSWDPADAMVDLTSGGTPLWSVDSAAITRYTKIQNRDGAYWVYYDLPMSGGEPVAKNYGRGMMVRFYRNPSPPIITYYAVPAASFTPTDAVRLYENHGRYLKNFGSGTIFTAPLYLPHGKYIRRMSFFYEAVGAATAHARLKAWTVGLSAPTTLIDLATSGSNWRVTRSDLQHGKLVDNAFVVYWLEWELPASYSEANHVLPSGVVFELGDYDDIWESYLPMVTK